MESKVSSKNIMLNYGVALGVVGLMPSLVQYALGQHLEQNPLYSVVSIVITIVFIVLGLKKFKAANDGIMSWGQGLKIGMGMTVISLVIGLIYLYIFSNVIEPTFKDDALARSLQQLQDTDYSQEVIDSQMQLAGDYFYVFMYGFAVAGALFIGFVISAITAAIMKKSDPNSY